MDANKDFLNLAKIYRSLGNSVGASLISLGGYYGGGYLLMLFPVPYVYHMDAYWVLWAFLTLAMGSTGIAFTSMLIVQLNKTAKNQGIALLGRQARFWIASMCIGITIVTWCCLWYFLATYYSYGSHSYIRLWPFISSDAEVWTKLMLLTIPAICIALVYYPVAWKQMRAIKTLFPPARSQWFPSSGSEGVKWFTIAGKLALIAAASSAFIPVFISYTILRPYTYDPVSSYVLNCMVWTMVAAGISVGAHGFAAVVAYTKSHFKIARGFIEIYREQAGLPPLPDGYRLPPGLLTRPAFFSPQEGDLNPAAFMGYPRGRGYPPGEYRGEYPGENRAPVQEPYPGTPSWGQQGAGAARPVYQPPPGEQSYPDSGVPVRSIVSPVMPGPSPQANQPPAATPAAKPMRAVQPETIASQSGNAPETATPGSDPVANPEPVSPSPDKPAEVEKSNSAGKAAGKGDELKLDFKDID